MGAVMETIKAVRNMRAEMNVPLGRKGEVILQPATDELATVLAENTPFIKTMATAEPVEIIPAGAPKPENSVSRVISGIEVYLPLKGLIDVEKEVARMNKELLALENELVRIDGKLANAGFVAKAPATVLEQQKERRTEVTDKMAAIRGQIEYFLTL